MDDLTGNPPADPAAAQEANDIINNKANPLNKDYWSGKQAAIDRVTALFAKSHPGNFGEDFVLQQHFEQSERAARRDGIELPGAELGEPTQAERQADEVLQQEWGADYQSHIESGARALQSLFPNAAEMEKAIQQSGILDDADLMADAIRLLAKMGAGRR